MSEKRYEFRELCAEDIFPMFKVMNKIGVRKFKDCFSGVSVSGEMTPEAVGIGVMFDIAGILIENLPDCENDIYALLAGVSNMKEKEIRKMNMGEFLEMIVDFFKKPEFMDFFKVVSKLFK